MKKMTVVLGSVCLLSLTSCFKKDRTCTCTDDDGDKSTVVYYKARKGDVRKDCMTTQVSYYDAKSGVTVTQPKRTCELD